MKNTRKINDELNVQIGPYAPASSYFDGEMSAEVSALYKYNKGFITKDKLPHMQAQVYTQKVLNGLMALPKKSTSTEYTIWHGSRKAEWSKLKVGTTYTSRVFTSATSNYLVAEQFSGPLYRQDPKYIVTIRVPKGFSNAVAKSSNLGIKNPNTGRVMGEAEVLLYPMTRYKVLKNEGVNIEIQLLNE